MGNNSCIWAEKNKTEQIQTSNQFINIEKDNTPIVAADKKATTKRPIEDANFVSLSIPKSRVNCKKPKKRDSNCQTTDFTDLPEKNKRSRNNIPELGVSQSYFPEKEGILEIPKENFHISFLSNFTVDIKLQRFKEMDDIDEGLKNELEKGNKINSYYVMNLIEKLQDIEDQLQQEFETVNMHLPYCHWEYKFSPDFTFKNVIDSVINPRKRMKWDAEIDYFKTIKYFAKDWSLVQTKYRKSNFADELETLEKRMCFKAESEDDNIVFITYSSPVPESFNSSSYMYNFWVTAFEAQEDGSTIMNSFVQFNSNLNLQNAKVISDSIKTRSVEWETNILNYLTSKLGSS